MNKITTVGLDLAKQVFHLVCCNKRGKGGRKKMLKRSRVLEAFTNLPPCLVGMEACAGAHYGARELEALGASDETDSAPVCETLRTGEQDGLQRCLGHC